MSYGCQQDLLKLDCFEQRVIEYISRQANSLTNCAIYALKRSSRQAGQIDFSYYDLDKHLKQNKNYKNLFSQVAQQTLMSVCESFKSHYEVTQLWYRGELKLYDQADAMDAESNSRLLDHSSIQTKLIDEGS